MGVQRHGHHGVVPDDGRQFDSGDDIDRVNQFCVDVVTDVTEPKQLPGKFVHGNLRGAIQLRRLRRPYGLDDIGGKTGLHRDAGVDRPFQLAVPVTARHRDRQFRQFPGQAAIEPQVFAERLPAVGQFRRVQGDAQRPDDSAALARDDPVVDLALPCGHRPLVGHRDAAAGNRPAAGFR